MDDSEYQEISDCWEATENWVSCCCSDVHVDTLSSDNLFFLQ